MRTLDYYSSWFQTAPDMHKSFGIILIMIITVRVFVRWKLKMPAPLENHASWEIKSAHLAHFIMYILLSCILVSGFLIGTADNRGIEVFGLFEVPALFTPFAEQEELAGAVHEWAAYILIGLVTLHVAGALKHHLIDKDQTLKRML
jgi:cytochrome b561